MCSQPWLTFSGLRNTSSGSRVAISIAKRATVLASSRGWNVSSPEASHASSSSVSGSSVPVTKLSETGRLARP